LGFWYGGTLVADSMDANCDPTTLNNSCVTGGNVIATFFSVIIGSFALGQAAPSIAAFVAAKAACAPLIEVINRKPLIDGLSEAGLCPSGRLSGNIEISGVRFAYPSRPAIMICEDYTLSIKAGETVALVGASGSGR